MSSYRRTQFRRYLIKNRHHSDNHQLRIEGRSGGGGSLGFAKTRKKLRINEWLTLPSKEIEEDKWINISLSCDLSCLNLLLTRFNFYGYIFFLMFVKFQVGFQFLWIIFLNGLLFRFGFQLIFTIHWKRLNFHLEFYFLWKIHSNGLNLFDFQYLWPILKNWFFIKYIFGFLFVYLYVVLVDLFVSPWKGDQASIVGGAIDFIKELEHKLLSLEAQKHHNAKLNQSVTSSTSQDSNGEQENPHQPSSLSLSQFFLHSYDPSQENRNGSTSSVKTPMEDLEVTLIETHANIRILSRRRGFRWSTLATTKPPQLSKLVASLQSLSLSILHLSVTTLDNYAIYSISAKVIKLKPYHLNRTKPD